MSTGTNKERIEQNNDLIQNNNAKIIDVTTVVNTLSGLTKTEYNACLTLANSIDNLDDYSDTTAKAEDIAKGKIAYCNGERIVGTSENITNNAELHPVLVKGNTNGPNNLGPLISKIPSDAVINGSDAQYMFFGCKYLTSIPLLDFSNLTNIDGIFHSCSSLVDVPQFDTSNVTNASRIFQGCSSLEEPPMLDLSNATQMIGIFHSCSKLERVPKYDTSKVTTFFAAFASCLKLTSAPDWDLSSATNIRSMFSSCSSLVDVPAYSIPKVTDMYNIFNDCYKLSDESLNNIMAMCISAVNYPANNRKLVSDLQMESSVAERCKNLPNYEAFIAAGWSI